MASLIQVKILILSSESEKTWPNVSKDNKNPRLRKIQIMNANLFKKFIESY